MDTHTQLLVTTLQSLTSALENGACQLTSDQVSTIINSLSPDTIFSKYQAAEYLHVSRATFNNLLAQHKLPAGEKRPGFSSLIWYKKDLDAYANKLK